MGNPIAIGSLSLPDLILVRSGLSRLVRNSIRGRVASVVSEFGIAAAQLKQGHH
jgi:hypothetical protein